MFQLCPEVSVYPMIYGSQRGSHSPHAMEPAHMAAFVMQRHIIVQRGIYASCPQTIRNRPQAQLPEGMADRKSIQGTCCHCHTDYRDSSGSQKPGHPVALQTGYHSTQRDNHGNRPGIGYRHSEFPVHGRPGRPQQGVRQSQTDKGQIDNR